MRRIQKVMTGIFLGGVLLGGIGTGTMIFPRMEGYWFW